MANDEILGFAIEDEDGFDPFAEGDFANEDDGASEDMPEVRELPPAMRRRGVYDADRFDRAEDALELLLKNNAGRRFIFLDIMEFCCEERTASEVAQFVDARQQANYSVYGPATLCRMLERSGGLVSRAPEPSAETVVEEDGAEYLRIKETDEVRWLATDAGLHVVAAHREGLAVRELVFGKEPQYEGVYRKVLAFLAQAPRKKPEIDALLEDEPALQVPPRRAPGHFVDMLENREAIEWTTEGWALSDVGRTFWNELCA